MKEFILATYNGVRYRIPLKENHKALYNWLAENPDKSKKDWPGFETLMDKFNLVIPARCFACATTLHPECLGCPINLSKEVMSCCINTNHPFYKMGRSETKEERTKYALEVRDMWK